jgi:hypothetical protein
MPWEKFKGELLSEIESSYLLWVLERADAVPSRLRIAIQLELSRRFPPPPPENGYGAPLPREVRVVRARIVKRGFRELAHEAHPDHGGSDAEMRQVLAAYELLCAPFQVEDP